MKFVFLLLLALFLEIESNSSGKCYECWENSRGKCAVCDESPCECEELISEDKTTFKKFIQVYLKKANFNPDQDCRNCGHPCSKKQGVAKLLAGILKKACTSENEEDTIKCIMEKLLDPDECKRKPCQPHCDPEVQLVLKSIWKKALGCNCKMCPSNCYEERPYRGQEKYQYWFKTCPKEQRREISDNTEPNRPQEMFESCPGTRNSCQDVNTVKKCNKNKEVYKCACENCKDSITCYKSDDCPIRSKGDLFSIYADCISCHVVPRKQWKVVDLICRGCKDVDSSLVQFTHTGHPFKKAPIAPTGLKIKTNFLQIDDFRLKMKTNHPTDEKRVKETIFNPFQPKLKGPVKKRAKGRRRKRKFKWR